MMTLENPLAALKKEADQIRSVVIAIAEKIDEVHAQELELQAQRATLLLVAEGIEMKMDSIRVNSKVDEGQLELALED